MDSLIFALNAVLPIVFLVAIGYALRRSGFLNDAFAKMANRVVFHVFLPAMLFLNVYKIDSIGDMEFDYVIYAAVVILLIFACSLPVVLMIAKSPARRGALWQATFRSNYALVGIPLAQSFFGDGGVMVATLLSAVVIPLLNVLAVVSLSVFQGDGQKPRVGQILLDIVKNPLIQSVAVGIAVLGIRAWFVEAEIAFRLSDVRPIYKTLESLSVLATPLALLSLGARFEFSAVSELRREIVFGTLMRTVIVPVLGVGTAYWLFRSSFSGAHFAAFIAVFATPVSISSVPMAQEMGGDVTLAGQLVVWSTLFSALSVFLTSFLLRSVGIF